MNKDTYVIGIIGCGAMGSGIAQVALQNGHPVIIFDENENARQASNVLIDKQFKKRIEKGKMSESQWTSCMDRLRFATNLGDLKSCNLIIEAIIEDLVIKQNLFQKLESQVSQSCIIATNTSSLSIAALSSAFRNPERFIGLHFFNPAPLMPLVEIIPGIRTAHQISDLLKQLMQTWEKQPVTAKDTPGFIVNRIARPFYSEALRIAEEGIADYATIDWAMKTLGQFKMGPFELMDLIGHDVNYRVTCSVWTELFYDPRFKPSITQKRWFEAGLYGRKTGQGCYSYSEHQSLPEPQKNTELGHYILNRILVMLINEAADALYFGVASAEDIEIAMKKGVNYPMGLLAWGNQLGISFVVQTLDDLYNTYQEERYRVSPKLRACLRLNTPL